MNRTDHYQDLLLYLEESKNEITEALEKNALNYKKSVKTPPNMDIIDEENNAEIDLKILIQINESIKSDISELLSRKKNQEDSIRDYHIYNNNIDIGKGINGIPYFDSNQIYQKHNIADKQILKTDILSECTGPELLTNSQNNNAATQTPSSPCSSTNLTWASECSSSPCLTSTSDSDLLDDDSHSTSSTDVSEQLATWSTHTPCCWRKQILNTKSSSAPVLKKMPIKVNKQSRSQSDRHLAEIEAAEACKWLRATGFPQYAQMFEEQQFPIDIATAAQDHSFLRDEPDVLHSLFRRLQILNSCANLHHQQKGVTHTDESEDECCALSNNWTYQKDIRRWSRTCNTMKIPNLEENAKNSENTSSQDKDEVFEKCTDSPKDRLRRAGSTKFRRRREGVLFSDKENVLDTISQLNELKCCEVNHVSDSEITPKHTRRSRTKSFDKTEVWTSPHPASDRVIWHKLPERDNLNSEKNITSSDSGGGPSISYLSCVQLQVLRKLALLKLTAHMEKYCPSHRTGWNWELPKFIRKIKTPNHKDKTIFGVPLTITLQRTGQPLPRNIEEALRWLQETGADQVGIFRKPGVKSRIQALRNLVETNEGIDYNDQQYYDVADMIKQYFRELPEALLTNKLSETFILIFQHVPPYLRRESVLCALLLLPDEHIEVLQAMLSFLLAIAKHSEVNQMNESNLAMCFAPSLFHYSQSYKQSVGSPHPKELAENKAAHECLLYFLKNYNVLFKIPKEFLNQCEIKETKAVELADLGRDIGGWRKYLSQCEMNLLKELKDKGRGWILINGHNPKVEITYKKVADEYPLRLWRVCADIDAPPTEVLRRVLRERHIWDPELHSAKIVSQIDKKTEVFQYVRRNISPLPNEEYCVVRTWRTDLPKDSCIIIETSIEHPDVSSVPHTARGIIFASRYLIEPCGSGRSRLLHLSRIDTMGRTPEWYQKNFGHMCALFVGNIQNSFYQNAQGPESKV